MLRLTFAQMRRSVGRLVAAGIAIAIGTAFVTATLLAGDVMTRTTTDAVAASLAGSDLVVDVAFTGQLTDTDVATLTDVAGVAAASPYVQSFQTLTAGDQRVGVLTVPVATDPALEAQDVVAGRLPAAPGEVAVPAPLAERIGAAVGGTAAIETIVWRDDDTAEEVSTPVDVVGLVEDPDGAYAMTDGALVATWSDIAAWDGYDASTGMATQVYVRLADGADVETVRGELADAVAALTEARSGTALDRPIEVLTKQEYAERLIGEFSGDSQAVVYVVLSFGALALIVAGLVIANTFQVLVAQRTRTLALLRCVGATKKQLRGSVLVEATVLGVAASAVGILAGAAAVQATLAILASRDIGVPLPSTITPTLTAVLVPLLAGTVVTVVSAFAPARAATRVAPLAALRPADAPSVRRGSTGRLVVSLLLTVGGAAMLAGGVAAGALAKSPEIGLLLGIPGGALSFIGLAVGSVFWIPVVTAGVGRLLGRTGASARLASANTLRNPRRTAATSTALLIGVTLVSMMSTGAASARATFNAELDSHYAIDATVMAGFSSSTDGTTTTTPLTDEVVAKIGAVDGVDVVVPVRSVSVDEIVATIPGGTTTLSSNEILAVDPVAARSALNDPATVEGLVDGVLAVPASGSRREALEGVTTARIARSDGTTLDLPVVLTSAGDYPLVTPATMETIATGVVTSSLWVSLGEADPKGAVEEIQSLVADLGVWVSGAIVERVFFEQVIDVLLAIVVGLLAVAVVIALIGVTNTLSLSVIERQRENAMLRAIGLSRRQLRATLAIEGLLIAVVGTALGVVLGVIYGWAGVSTILGSFGNVAYAVSGRDVGLVLVVSIVAGLLASVVPARRAVRTSPVEALAVD